jgi:hypothetical protein
LIINSGGPLLKSGAKRFLEGVYGTIILILDLQVFRKFVQIQGGKKI